MLFFLLARGWVFLDHTVAAATVSCTPTRYQKLHMQQTKEKKTENTSLPTSHVFSLHAPCLWSTYLPVCLSAWALTVTVLHDLKKDRSAIRDGQRHDQASKTNFNA